MKLSINTNPADNQILNVRPIEYALIEIPRTWAAQTLTVQTQVPETGKWVTLQSWTISTTPTTLRLPLYDLSAPYIRFFSSVESATWPVDLTLHAAPANIPQPRPPLDGGNVAAWQWYTYPSLLRLGRRTLLGTVGTARAEVYDLHHDTGLLTRTVVGAVDEKDDHNQPALLRLAGGTILLAYALHNTDGFIRLRKSTNPDDGTAWEPEYTYLFALAGGGHTTAYAALFAASNGDVLLAARRVRADLPLNGSGLMEWAIAWSQDAGDTFPEKRVVWRSKGDQRAGGNTHNTYCRIAQHPDNPDRLDIFGTPASSEAGEWRLKHCYWNYNAASPGDSTVHTTDGTQLVSGVDTDLYTPVYDGSDGRDTYHELNDTIDPLDVSHDHDKNPICLFSRTVKDNAADKRLMEARLVNGQWTTAEIHVSGGPWNDTSTRYPGLAAYVPGSRGNELICAKQEDGAHGRFYEIQHWRRVAGAWEKHCDITRNSEHHNTRPLVAAHPFVPDGLMVAWQGKGTTPSYTTYTTRAQLTAHH